MSLNRSFVLVLGPENRAHALAHFGMSQRRGYSDPRIYCRKRREEFLIERGLSKKASLRDESGVVEDFIQWPQPAFLDFLFGLFPQAVEAAILRVFLDLAVPFVGMTLPQMPHELEKILPRQLRNRLLDLADVCHAYNLPDYGRCFKPGF